jgi:predicted anti-sigma-YlaC factor YlaD
MTGSCRAVRERLSDDLDGEVTGWRRAAMRLHLRLCPACRRVAGSLADTVAALRELRTPDT